MFRRRFLQFIPLATTLGLAPLKAMAKAGSEVVTYRVKGFSCVTCATGLDTMLGQQKGVASSKSTYPEGIVKVAFDPEVISKKQIADLTKDGVAANDRVIVNGLMRARPGAKVAPEDEAVPPAPAGPKEASKNGAQTKAE